MNAENEMVDPNRPYTVGCRLAHLVPDRTHAAAIEDAVTRVHRATFLATELANLHLRPYTTPRAGLRCVGAGGGTRRHGV